MEWTAIQAGWNHVYKGNAQRRFSKLTLERVDATHARREELVALVQGVYRLSAEKAEEQVADWQSRQRPVRELLGDRW